jgi:hypothetical protein
LSHLESREDECFILVKAQPHRSSKYHETVCCAGIGSDGKWRRQYPVPFRVLEAGQKFERWRWIKYRFSTSRADTRRESQKVVPESIVPGGKLKPTEAVHFLNPLIRASLSEANSLGESLAMVRPSKFDLSWKRKSDGKLAIEAMKHAELANQLSWLDKTARPLEPCPFEFRVRWHDQDGKYGHHICDDWETAQAFRNFRNLYGETEGLAKLKTKYEDYFERGLAFAFSTHSRRNVTFNTRNQWLLVGMIRLNRSSQPDLFL